MGFLKVRKVKGNEYLYWCKRTRSRKKFGGDGKVRSVEYCLGRKGFPEWLPFYAYTGDVDFQSFVEQCLKKQFDKLELSIAWEKDKPILSGLRVPGVDGRTKEAMEWKSRVENYLEWFSYDYHPSSIEEGLEGSAEWWKSYLVWKEHLSEWLDKQKEYEKNPERTWGHTKEERWDANTMTMEWYDVWYEYPENFALTLDENLSYYRKNMDDTLNDFERSLKSLGELIPPKQRDTYIGIFKKKAQERGYALFKR